MFQEKIIKKGEVTGKTILSLRGEKTTPRDEPSYEEGKKIGYTQAKKEFCSDFSLITSLSQRLLEEQKRLMDRLKPEMIELTLAIAEKIIRQELSHPEKLMRMIDSLLTATMITFQEEKIVIFVSPQDYMRLKEQKVEGTLLFVSDSLLQQGDCRIETKSKLINSMVARELEDLKTNVL